jgi:hypothetical protein
MEAAAKAVAPVRDAPRAPTVTVWMMDLDEAAEITNRLRQQRTDLASEQRSVRSGEHGSDQRGDQGSGQPTSPIRDLGSHVAHRLLVPPHYHAPPGMTIRPHVAEPTTAPVAPSLRPPPRLSLSPPRPPPLLTTPLGSSERHSPRAANLARASQHLQRPWSAPDAGAKPSPSRAAQTWPVNEKRQLRSNVHVAWRAANSAPSSPRVTFQEPER